MRIKQSMCYPLFLKGDMTIERLFTELSSAGYAAVELWFRGDDFEDVAALAKRNNLAVASICGHHSLPDGLNKKSNHDRIEAEITASIDVAAKHGVPGLICFSGNRNEGQSDADAIETVAQGLRRVAPYAEKKGINLNMELLNSKVDHAGYQCDHTEWGVRVCERVNSPRVKLLYDIYHMQIMEGDVIRTVRQHIKWIGHFHTAGNPGRRDMDDSQELNYVGICRAIAETDYAGYLGHEFQPKAETAPDLVASLRRAYEICNQG